MTALEIIRTIIEAIGVIAIIIGFVHEGKIARWERKVLFPAIRRIKKKIILAIRDRLRKCPRIVAWASKPTPTISERIANSFPPVKITVFYGWRKQYGLSDKK